ncbi:MAG: cyclase family protein [Candidatus Saganbacteria bacterium]|nr:cyclase family protein [Candidatus Saganbacteria bacterium]
MTKERVKYQKISYDLDPAMPIFFGNRRNVIRNIDSFSKGMTWNSYKLVIFNHNGTHIDTPNHFDAKGKKIADYHIGEFVFNAPCLVDVAKKEGEAITAEDLKKFRVQIKKADILLIRTGFQRMRGKPAYVKNNPWIRPDAARFIRKNFPALRAVGIDTVSIASFAYLEKGGESHRILLKKGKFRSSPLLLIEDLDLLSIDFSIKKLFAIPLYANQVDSMPCTAFVQLTQ